MKLYIININMNQLPNDIENIIYKNLHNMYFSDCLIELRKQLRYRISNFESFDVFQVMLPHQVAELQEIVQMYYNEGVLN